MLPDAYGTFLTLRPCRSPGTVSECTQHAPILHIILVYFRYLRLPLGTSNTTGTTSGPTYSVRDIVGQRESADDVEILKEWVK